MKLRFWQKTYVLTLLLFFLCLYAGVFGMTWFSWKQNVKLTENACFSEAAYIVLSFTQDRDSLPQGGEAVHSLMRSYTAAYVQKGILLKFTVEGKTAASAFPELSEGIEPAVGKAKRVKLQSKNYCLIHMELADGTLLYGKNTDDAVAETEALVLQYALIAAGLTVILAILLPIFLKKLSAPLQNLAKIAERVRRGDLSLRADESGSDEFADLAHSFNRMLQELRDQQDRITREAEQKQRLVDDMAHELRTPLTVIRGYAELISQANVSENEKIDAAGQILRESERLRRISDKILDTAVLREKSLQKERLRLDLVVRDTADRLSAEAEKRKITLTAETPPCYMEGDALLISLLCMNLTENAMKGTADGGQIRLSCKEGSITVEDNGCGMNEEQLAHITEPFYRVDKNRSRAEGGVGLGLSLCRQIVLAHGGTMYFSSQPGKGTKVFVDFTDRKDS